VEITSCKFQVMEDQEELRISIAEGGTRDSVTNLVAGFATGDQLVM